MYLYNNELAPALTLDGVWDFTLGPGAPRGTIRVPGCWEAQGYSKHLDGPAHYRREVLIPSEWAGQRIFAEFDAVSYACVLSCNGKRVGEHRGLWTPFAFDVTPVARPGQPNTFELEVYKPGERFPVRSCLAGFLPDVATTFGGIWQPARLRALTVGLHDLWIAPDLDTGELRVCCQAIAFGLDLANSDWEVEVLQDGQRVAAKQVPMETGGALNSILAIPEPIPWSPQNPALYRVRVRLTQNGKILAETSERIGFRHLTRAGDQLLFNHQPVCLRGVLSWGWDPDRIAPAFDAQQVRDEIRRVRALGFNLIKLCLFVPNQTYFDIADEEGILLWQEWPLWLPQVTPEMRARLPIEYAELMRLTRHHPSVVLYSLGCELSTSVDAGLLSTLNDTARGLASHVLFCDNSGSGEAYGGLPFDFSDFTDYHPYGDLHHFEPLLDHWRRDWRPPRPWVFGEFCDSDGFRDLNEIIAAHGGRKPWWLTEDLPVHTWRPEARALLEEQERLAQANLGFTPQELTRISRLQSLVVRKYILEAVRRRAGMGGYVITGLRDTPITTSGILDDLDRPKWSPEEFRPFNDDAILCLDGDRRRRWQHGGDRVDRLDMHNWWAEETARWHVILSHTGAPLPAGGELSWQLTDQAGHVIAKGQSEIRQTILPGPPRELATIECHLPAVEKASELRLQAHLTVGSITVANQWPIWCYPRPTAWPARLAMYDPSYALDGWDELIPTAQRITSERVSEKSEPAPFAPGGAGFSLPRCGLKPTPHGASGLKSTPHGKSARLSALLRALEPGPHPTQTDFATPSEAPGWEPSVILATALTPWLQEYLRAGGRVLLLQQGDGPLPSRRGPFWREAIHLFPDHPLWQTFPHRGYADLQFFGLATDVMLDAARLDEAVSGVTQIRPLMRRLDAREFLVTEYLLEAQVGSGLLLACTLRLQGGVGAQPSGVHHNVAGSYLLWAMLDYLERQ